MNLTLGLYKHRLFWILNTENYCLSFFVSKRGINSLLRAIRLAPSPQTAPIIDAQLY